MGKARKSGSADFLETMSREFYKCKFRLNQKDAFLLWFSDDKDGVITNSSGAVICFDSLRSLKQFASRKGWKVHPEKSLLHNFDKVISWLDGEGEADFEYDEFLSVWNLLGDVSDSVGGNFDLNRKRTNKIYNKLFWGNNLMSITPENRKFKPEWTREERRLMHSILLKGIKLFQSSLTKSKRVRLSI